ncbi:hypothetical protein [Natrinema salifodinae]|uniref:Uncharacterized protein n=1 Tax=Natrinema salifodinae TaxID=1202768 RepID=A0A1I0N0Y3_9EURY|nr:hypothetical protein [Natrinema salifodinae]SEV94716.1 hypothetical protein SAMN05216285_1226 [Natrinema salifodinae]
MTFDDLADVLADEDSDNEEEEQSNEYFEDLDDVLDDNGELDERLIEQSDGGSMDTPLRYDRDDRDGDGIVDGGVDLGYDGDGVDQSNETDGEDGNLGEPNTDETNDDGPEPLTRSSGNGDYMVSGSTEDTDIRPHGVDSGYGGDGIIDQEDWWDEQDE